MKSAFLFFPLLLCNYYSFVFLLHFPIIFIFLSFLCLIIKFEMAKKRLTVSVHSNSVYNIESFHQNGRKEETLTLSYRCVRSHNAHTVENEVRREFEAQCQHTMFVIFFLCLPHIDNSFMVYIQLEGFVFIKELWAPFIYSQCCETYFLNLGLPRFHAYEGSGTTDIVL